MASDATAKGEERQRQADQKFVRFFSWIVWPIVALYLYVAFKYEVFAYFNLPHGKDTLSRRLTYATRLQLPLATYILALTVTVGQIRFSTTNIDPLKPPLVITTVLNNILRNTVEQGFVHILAVTAFATLVPAHQFHMVAAYVLLFIVGRVLFLVGYLISSRGRAAGMSITFTSNVTLLVFTYALVWKQGIKV